MTFHEQAPPPVFSVVVIGRNEGARLTRCLKSVAAADFAECPVEVIYVDSNSTDNSVELARTEGATVISLSVRHPTAALGRNAGWRQAKGEYVLFLDGDTELKASFPKVAFAAIQQDQVAIVWGHRRESCTGASIYNRILDLDWVVAPGLTEFCGGDALMRRQVLEQVNGFDQTLIAGEEPEMCRRIRALGYKIDHINEPMTSHDLGMTSWQQYWRRAIRAGHAYAQVAARFRNSSDPFWSKEARGNLVRSGLLGFGLFLCVGLSMVLSSAWPLVAVVVLALMAVLRSAWRARWKGSDPVTLLAYAAHSHLQQFPIALGQIMYRFDRRRDKTPVLIEYK